MSEIDTLIWTVFNHPLTYVIVIGAIFFLVIREINKGKLRPEQKPDFGVKVRAARVQDHLKKRDQHFAVKPKKAFLFRDVYPIGKIVSIEDIPQHSSKQQYIYSICYRRLGFVSWLFSALGFMRKRVLVDDQNIKNIFDDKKNNVRKGQIQYFINKNVYFRERGGMMILSNKLEKEFIDEINADKDYENVKGFVSDFPRRLSNLHPAHASKTDTLELESDLEERSEQKKRHIWGGK